MSGAGDDDSQLRDFEQTGGNAGTQSQGSKAGREASHDSPAANEN